MNENIRKFVEALKTSLAAETFVKMTLGNYKGNEAHLQKIFVRPVETKKGARLLFQFRYDTRDVVKNLEFADGVASVRNYLETGFRSGHLFTTEGDTQLGIGKRNSRLTVGKPTFTAQPSLGHDRDKKTLIDPNAFYLKALGIATDSGQIRASQQDKWRQINKFVEILAGLVENSSLKHKTTLRIVDMGSGKGYLTFAAYDYFVRHAPGSPPYEGGVEDAAADGVVLLSSPPCLGGVADASADGVVLLSSPPCLGGVDAASADGVVERPTKQIQMTGVEQRPELVTLCNDIAKAGGFDGLNFVQGTIADYDPGEVDILIALHACDTATDDALFKAITAKAEIIVAAPCCHKEIRPQITPPEMLSGILKHGIMLERTAETITDGLRSLLLERSGYATKLFEFIATEHTPKNNMLVGTRNAKNSDVEKAERQIAELKAFYGIGEQRLESLLESQNQNNIEKI